MGGIQTKIGSPTEIHAVRGGQLVLRVAPSSLILHHALEDIPEYDGYPFLPSQSMDILEKIFAWLTPRDLAMLSLSSKTLYSQIHSFLRHKNKSNRLKQGFLNFYRDNRSLLLPKEQIFEERWSGEENELLIYSARHRFSGMTIRQSCTESFQFDQSGAVDELRCIIRERDVELKRDVVLVQAVCWLHFNHSFDNVDPGKYVLTLRLRLGNKLIWPTKASELRVNVNEDQYYLQEVSGSWWKDMAGQIFIPPDNSNINVSYERDSDWLFIHFKKLTIKEPQSIVEFVFHDMSPHWKSNMVWDYVELKKL